MFCATIYDVEPVTSEFVCPASVVATCPNHDPKTCQCIPDVACNLMCAPGTFPDYQNCRCVTPPIPPCSIKCPPNSIPDFNTCTCRCSNFLIKECVSPASLDNDTCVCTPSPIQCRLGCPYPLKSLHPARCECFCHFNISRQCSRGFSFNEDTCRCEPLQLQPVPVPGPEQPTCLLLCISPFELDAPNCKCYCPASVNRSCGIFGFDEEKCKCNGLDISIPDIRIP